jgi:ABC-type lipoprotein export system ATPase subunit
MELFQQVAHDQGAAVLVVTHDHRSLGVFDVIHEMEDGRVRPYVVAPSSAGVGQAISFGPSRGEADARP